MLDKGVELDEHDLGKERLTAEQLDTLIGARNYIEFLNPRNELYRQQLTARPARENSVP